VNAPPLRKAAFELVVDGKRLDFGHLEPFEFPCATAERPQGAIIGVRFSNHCFTETYDPQKHEGRPIHMDGNRQRAFCPVRFSLSVQLPELVRALPEGHVFMTPETNYVRVELDDGIEYRMFFNMRRAANGDGHDIRMYVESAYRPDAGALSTSRMQKVRFKVAVDKLLRNEKLRFKPR
jgi:hypothetical protein